MSEYRLLQATLAIRKEAKHQAELTNQMLYGERFEILSQEVGWIKLKSIHDNYEGWAEEKIQLEPYIKVEQNYMISKSFADINYREDIYLLPFGSLCPSYMLKHNRNKNDFITIGLGIAEALNLIKSQFNNAPYLWGGRTPMGVDCSGLTQLYGRCIGIELERDAWQQAKQGHSVPLLENSIVGDLIFFKNENNHICHVGINIGKAKIIHASGKVRIDLLNAQGIINGQSGKLTHNLAEIRRIQMS